MERWVVAVLCAMVGGALWLAAEPVTRLPVEVGDLTLTNGKVFKAVVVMSQTSSAINVRHAGGLTKIEKALLPLEMLARFPVSEEMAAKEEQARREGAQRRAQEEAAARQKRLQQVRPAPAGPVTPAPRADAAATSPSVVKRATPQEQVARAPHGLYILNWNGGYSNEASVTVCNPTGSPQKLDPRQLRGLMAGSGQQVGGVELKFRVQEIADAWVKPGQTRSFTVKFESSGVVAIGWDDGREWRVTTTTEAAAAERPDQALALAREIAAEAKERARRDSAEGQAASAKAQADKRLINR